VQCVGRPCQTGVRLVAEGAFHAELIEDVRNATSVIAASLSYDDPKLHEVLVHRLNGSSEFSLEVFVDRAQYHSGKPKYYMKKRLGELREAGATVWLQTGYDHEPVFGKGGRGKVGQLHSKAVVLDNHIAFGGSANLSMNSRAEKDMVWRFVGPPVRDVWERLMGYRVGAARV
jgi:phosphatidylserine/phosphatidylglycerophosphate/cardiolipin synthase-like enzyme